MVEKISVYQCRTNDPYYNLAVEKYLLDTVAPNECILYLWQNQNTVVIGRNQNPWTECRTTLLEEEGGRLARRLSGGGAVFHDLGNLNFTFLINKENYDVDRQLSVIQAACALTGIRAEKSGRNDLLAGGSKFSGNAFYQIGQNAYHHGTLLIDVDMDRLSRYLSPSKAKLEAKGVSSVRSRVINLKELSPGLTCEKMRELMVKGFEEVYGLTAENITIPQDALAGIEETAKHNGSWDFLYGTPLPFTFSCEKKFDWGIFQLQLQAKNGIIQAVKVYSDAMDWTLPANIEQALTGCRFALGDMQAALQAYPDLCELLAEQSL
jgi:lipoate-protein ligase A